MQKPERPNAVFEIAVPDGTNRVHLVSGDPSQVDSVFRVNVEGVPVVNGTRPRPPAGSRAQPPSPSRRPPDRQQRRRQQQQGQLSGHRPSGLTLN
jgi:hypothetical protein